jgi:chromosome segregation ATPase
VQTDFSTSPADCIIEKHPVLVNNLLSGVPDEGPKISVGLQTDVEHSTMEKMQQDYLVQQLQRRICDLEGKSEQSEFDLEEQKIHVEETKEKLCQVEEERESIKHQYELLIDAHSCLKDKLSQLRQEKADLVQKCNSLQSEVNTMIENECESVDNLQQKISDMENENANLRNNISEFKVKMEDVASMYQSKMEEAQQEVLDLNKANSRLKCESEKTFAEREHMIIELNALSEAKEQAHSDYKGLLARMNADMENHQQTVAKVQQQLVDGEMEKQCLMEKNRDLAKLCEDTKAQCEEFVSKNDELLVKLTSSKESYEGLELKFKQVYQQKHALEQERIKYSQELDKIEEKLQIAEREKRECEGMVQLATRKSVDLETEKQCEVQASLSAEACTGAGKN